MNEQLINDRIRLDNINSEMSRISNVAREYMNASQEQRDRVDPQLLASVLDRYNMLRADKLALEQSVAAREMEAQRQAQQVQPVNTYRTIRRQVVPTPTPTPTPINEEVIIEQPATQQMDLYHQNMINDLVRQGRANNVSNVLNGQNRTAWNTIISSNWGYPGSAQVANWVNNPTPGASIGRSNNNSYTRQRNNMPWYRQIVTPYSEGYLREQWYL